MYKLKRYRQLGLSDFNQINQMIVSKTLYWEDKGMNVIWST